LSKRATKKAVGEKGTFPKIPGEKQFRKKSTGLGKNKAIMTHWKKHRGGKDPKQRTSMSHIMKNSPEGKEKLKGRKKGEKSLKKGPGWGSRPFNEQLSCSGGGMRI